MVDLFLEGYKKERPTRRAIAAPDTFSTEQNSILNLCDQQLAELHSNGGNLSKYSKVQRTVFVQGVAGAGKSTVIREIRRRAIAKFHQDVVIVMAPTGVAAHNIEGMTIHSAIGLSGTQKEYAELQGIPAQKFKERFDGKLIILIDEHSMISARLLSTLEKRLHELRPQYADIPFAGFYVYFFGDIRQLVPVAELPMYTDPIHVNHPDILHGINLFRGMDKYFELQMCQRQKNDQAFIEFLNRLGDGQITEDDYEKLKLRREANISAIDREHFNNSIHLFPKKDDVAEYNMNALRKLNTPVARIAAKSDTNVAREGKDDNTGIPDVLQIAIGCRVMLRRNLWTEGGLVNGSIGTVRAIVYNNKHKPPEHPAYILVEFDNYNGPFFTERCFPVVPQMFMWTKNGITHALWQFPLTVTCNNNI